MVDEQNKDEQAEESEEKVDKFDAFTDEGEAIGYISLDQARVLAIQHARDNTDFYGSKFRGRQLVWEVVSQEEGEDFYDIRLSYRPAGRFTGTPGVEQFTIDKTGEIRIRQILDEPVEESRRGSRLRMALLLALVGGAAIAVVLVVLSTSGEGGPFAKESSPTATAAPFPRSSAESPVAFAAGLVIAEDFENGFARDIETGPNAEIRCDGDGGNCYLRHLIETDGDDRTSDFGELSWSNYMLRFRFNVRTEGSVAGAVIRKNQNDDRYSIHMEPEEGLSQLDVIFDGARRELDVEFAPFSLREWHELEVLAEGTHVELRLDGRLVAVHDVPEEHGPLSGAFDVHTHAAGGPAEVWYDDIQVELLGEEFARAQELGLSQAPFAGEPFFEDFQQGGRGSSTWGPMPRSDVTRATVFSAKPLRPVRRSPTQRLATTTGAIPASRSPSSWSGAALRSRSSSAKTKTATRTW